MRDVLRQVGMSRSGLEKAFREYYVRAPMEELRKVRIEKAKKMLRETDEAVLSIAVFVGSILRLRFVECLHYRRE